MEINFFFDFLVKVFYLSKIYKNEEKHDKPGP